MLRSSFTVIGVGLVTLGALGAPTAIAGTSHNCDGRPATLVGTSDGGDDRLDGDSQVDVMWGGAGDDALYPEAGDDRLHGGSGRDILRGGYGDDRLVGGVSDPDQPPRGPRHGPVRRRSHTEGLRVRHPRPAVRARGSRIGFHVGCAGARRLRHRRPRVA